MQQMLFTTDMERGADFSPCRTWRYALWRKWNEGTRLIAFCGLNPSTADERLDDNTVTRCIRFARRWGFDGMFMLNAYAFRSTDPAGLQRTPDPTGPGNDKALAYYAERCEKVVVAWGVHCEELRARRVTEILKKSIGTVHCFGQNKGGSPKHPLYLKNESELHFYA